MSELKKVAKVIELGGDIKNLETEITKLESKKSSIINETDSLKKDVNKSILADRQLLSKDREDLEAEKNAKNKELDKREAAINQLEKESLTRVVEVEVLNEKIRELKDKEDAFKAEKKSVETIKVQSLEKQKLAELKIEQYEKKLKEINA